MSFTVDPHVLRESAERGDRWYPYAVEFPIPEALTQRKIRAILFILHSMAGPNMTSLEAIRRYYYRDDIHTESTWGLAMSGECAQFVPVDVRADCNADANNLATSVETQDLGSATLATTKWSPEQVEQLAGLSAWQHMNPLCALTLGDPADWNQPGVGYHSEHDEWSIYVGKTCPGAARIAQMPEIRRRAVEIIGLAYARPVEPTPTVPPLTPTEGDDMGLNITVFQPSDCLAEFIAYTDDNGFALEVEWIRTPDDQRRRDAYLATGKVRVDRGKRATVGGFRNCGLKGPVPVGDTYPWTDGDFAYRVPKATG